jgi:hypothetical protein
VTAAIVAILKWDPTIRGILFPAIQFVILVGSTYVILSTNVGNRLGFLLANAAFWGWMSLMCIVWLIYGIGLKGPAPFWRGQEAITNISEAQLAPLRALSKIEPSKYIPPAIKPGDDKAAAVESKLEPRKFAGWTEVKEGTPTRGEAASNTDSFVKKPVTEGGAGLFKDKGGPYYKSVAAYETGGEQIVKLRPRKERGGDWYNPADYRFMGLWHGPHYYVEVLQRYQVRSDGSVLVDDKDKPILDSKAPLIYVQSIRNSGAVRLPAWKILFASLVLLIISVGALHKRDKQLMAHMSVAKAA